MAPFPRAPFRLIASFVASPAAKLFTDQFVWFTVVVAYLLGSIPFGLLLAKWLKGVDLRAIGSGNIGATNASRALGRKWGLVVFALDFVKGWAPVYCAKFVGSVASDDENLILLRIACGTAAVLGHCYSIYLGFKGGKGVATGCGAIVAISFWIFACGGAVWLLTRFITRYAGLASIMMGFTFPLAAWLLPFDFLHLPDTLEPHCSQLVIASSLLTLLIFVRHRSNIQRMLAGTEPRAGEKRPPSESEAARHHG